MKKTDFVNWLIATAVACATAGVSGVLASLLLHKTMAITESLTAEYPWAPPFILLFVGALAGLAWWWIRRKPTGSMAGILRGQDEDLAPGRSLLDAGIQVASVGFGASIGREAAPRLAAAAMTWLAGRSLPRDLRQLVTAASAGGALGAVYNAPWAGAVYMVSILLPGRKLLNLVTAVLVSWAGVIFTRAILGNQHSYPLGHVQAGAQVWLWVLLTILLAPLVGLGFTFLQKRFIKKVSLRLLPLTVALAFGLTGLIGIFLPEINGNGTAILHSALERQLTFKTLLILLVLKAMMTVLTLSSGAVGGVLMPAFSLGACLGGIGALLISGADNSAFILIAAGAVLSVTQKSWAFGIVFALELTQAPFALWLPVIFACLGAYYLAKNSQKWLLKRA